MELTIQEIPRCSKCVMPTALPSVQVDAGGVCNYCQEYEENFASWSSEAKLRQKELDRIFEKAMRLNRSYDCLIPLSGGKDSTYALYVCNRVYHLRCLCITFDNGFLSKYAQENIRSAVKATNTDHIFYTIDRETLLKLYRLFTVKCGHFCSVCMRGINAVTLMAEKYFQIPLVVTGAGRRLAYLGNIPELFEGGEWHFFKSVIKDEQLEQNCGSLLMRRYESRLQRMNRHLRRLSRIPPPILPRHIGLCDYVEVSMDEILSTIKEQMGWESPPGDPEHMDCLVHEIQRYIHTLKFPELTYYTCYHSGLIRQGRMTREEALRLEELELRQTTIPKMVAPFLSELDLKEGEFDLYVRNWKNMAKFRKRKRRFVASLYHRVVRD